MSTSLFDKLCGEGGEMTMDFQVGIGSVSTWMHLARKVVGIATRAKSPKGDVPPTAQSDNF